MTYFVLTHIQLSFFSAVDETPSPDMEALRLVREVLDQPPRRPPPRRRLNFGGISSNAAMCTPVKLAFDNDDSGIAICVSCTDDSSPIIVNTSRKRVLPQPVFNESDSDESVILIPPSQCGVETPRHMIILNETREDSIILISSDDDDAANYVAQVLKSPYEPLVKKCKLE